MRRSSLDRIDVAISREIDSQFDSVKIVADNIDDVVAVVNATATTAAVADNIDAITAIGSHVADIVVVNSNMADVTSVADNMVDISAVATNIGDISSVVTTVLPVLSEILQADDNAATATAARIAAEIAKGIAETKAAEAGLSAVAADLSADLAAASEIVATTKANAASTSADAAHVSELAAAAILDTFDDRYLGALASNPIVDNDGNALLNEAIYFNTSTHNLRVYDAGLVDWIALSSVTFAGLQDVSLTSTATGDILKWNGTDWVNTKVVGLSSLQLLGGVSTQGTMTWNADEETVDLIQNGATLQIGQELQTHVRNGTASTIANGKVVMATGTIGTSGRIVAGLYDGVAGVKHILGVTTEDVPAGDDGKVTHFGKVRGINTSAWNEYDLLYPTSNGGFTNVTPTTGVRVALAMVVTKHATNGTIMVRANGVDELAYEPKNVNIQTHIASTSNPHSVTKAQVGLGNVDNTADATKNVLSATKLTTARSIQLSGAVTGTADFDGSAAINIVTTHTADPVITLDGDATGSVTLTNLGSGTLTVSVVDDSHNHVVDNVDGLRAELDAKSPLASPVLTGIPLSTTAAVGTNTTQIATTEFVQAEIANGTYSKTELDTGQLDNRYYTETEINMANILRADKYLAAQSIAAMSYGVDDNLSKIQYSNATDVDYEVFAYSSGNLTSIQHYVGSVLKGTTTLSYTSGNLVSAIFVGV